MVVMTPGATQDQVDAVVARLETTGVHVVVMPGELTTAIGAIGDPAGVAALGLEVMPGVDRIVPISRPYKLASRELGAREASTVAVDGHRVGPDTFALIAGPCTVETREQTLAVARAVKKGGASMMRAGVWKPRTSPFSFPGLGEAGLDIVREAKEETGLPVVTELTTPDHAEALARAAAAVGADGIIVEIADDPEAALCDGPQQLYASDFARFADSVIGHAALVGKRLA